MTTRSLRFRSERLPRGGVRAIASKRAPVAVGAWHVLAPGRSQKPIDGPDELDDDRNQLAVASMRRRAVSRSAASRKSGTYAITSWRQIEYVIHSSSCFSVACVERGPTVGSGVNSSPCDVIIDLRCSRSRSHWLSQFLFTIFASRLVDSGSPMGHDKRRIVLGSSARFSSNT